MESRQIAILERTACCWPRLQPLTFAGYINNHQQRKQSIAMFSHRARLFHTVTGQMNKGEYFICRRLGDTYRGGRKRIDNEG
jgi:hypothetical protein